MIWESYTSQSNKIPRKLKFYKFGFDKTTGQKLNTRISSGHVLWYVLAMNLSHLARLMGSLNRQ